MNLTHPESAGNTGPLPLFSEAEFSALPEPEYFIDGILPMAGNAMLFGRFGSGKTFFALHLACLVAAGRPWMGRAVRDGMVVYITAEGRGAFARRLRAWRQRYPTAEGELLLHPAPVSLLSAVTGDRIVAALEQRLAEVEIEVPILLVFDTLHRCIPGGDENDSATVSLALAAIQTVRDAHPLTTALLIHHPPKQGSDPRGSGAWQDDLDTVLALEREADTRTVRVTCLKQRDGEPFEPFTFDLEEEADSLVVADAATWAVQDQRTLTRGERAILAALHDLAPERGSWSRWQAVAGVAPSTLARTRKRLLSLGLVEAKQEGRRHTYALTGEGVAALLTPDASAEVPRNYRGTTSFTTAPPIRGAGGSGSERMEATATAGRQDAREAA